MGISPVSAGINANYGLNAVETTSAPQVKGPEALAQSGSEAVAQASSDAVSLGSAEPQPKKGFLNWLKDLVKTEVDGPSESYMDRTCRALDGILAKAQPGDIPDTMPQKAAPAPGEPTEYYIPGGGSHSGISLPVPSHGVPSKESVADYHYISQKDAISYYAEQGFSEKMSAVQKGVIKQYCGDAFGAMNGHLLNGQDNETGTIDKAVRCAAGALDKCAVPSGIVLNRCASASELLNYCDPKDYPKYKKFIERGKTEKLAQILDQRLTGTQSTRKTFISTSVGDKADFIDTAKVTTKFYVGEGVKGVYVSADADLAHFNGEKEYLLAPNTDTTVLGVEYNPETKGITMHVFLGEKAE